MPTIIDGPDGEKGQSLRRSVTRLAWFVLIWALSVAAIGAVAYGLRWLLKP